MTKQEELKQVKELVARLEKEIKEESNLVGKYVKLYKGTSIVYMLPTKVENGTIYGKSFTTTDNDIIYTWNEDWHILNYLEGYEIITKEEFELAIDEVVKKWVDSVSF